MVELEAVYMSKRIVVIGDIIDSQELSSSDRSKIQEKLSRRLETLNNESSELLTPYTITLGDEFQAMYRKADRLLEDTWTILAELHPVKVRFSIGIGSIVTPLNKEQTLGMDGPAFYAARAGIGHLKENRFLYQVDVKEETEQSASAAVNLINCSLRMLSTEMMGWKKTRFQILDMLNREVAVKKIAKNLDISETAVYKNKDDGNLELVIQMKESICDLLNEEIEK